MESIQIQAAGIYERLLSWWKTQEKMPNENIFIYPDFAFILHQLILMSDKTTGVSHASKIESTKVCACPLNKQFF